MQRSFEFKKISGGYGNSIHYVVDSFIFLKSNETKSGEIVVRCQQHRKGCTVRGFIIGDRFSYILGGIDCATHNHPVPSAECLAVKARVKAAVQDAGPMETKSARRVYRSIREDVSNITGTGINNPFTFPKSKGIIFSKLINCSRYSERAWKDQPRAREPRRAQESTAQQGEEQRMPNDTVILLSQIIIGHP